MKYLLDTSICIYLFKGQYSLKEKINTVGLENCAISEITYAELIYGAEKSNFPEKNFITIEKFTDQMGGRRELKTSPLAPSLEGDGNPCNPVLPGLRFA